MKLAEHLGSGCNCIGCTAGKRSKAVKAHLRHVNRQIRHRTKQALATLADPAEFVPIVVSTGYTD